MGTDHKEYRTRYIIFGQRENGEKINKKQVKIKSIQILQNQRCNISKHRTNSNKVKARGKKSGSDHSNAFL